MIEDTSKNICVVRLRTEYWHDNNGCYIKKSLKFLKRKCKGFNILYEDVSHVGFEDVFTKIVNIDECTDGVYKCVTCNDHRDWETGIVEDYDYKLIKMEI